MRNLYPQFKTILIVIFLLTNVWLSFGQTSINVSCPWISQNVCNDGIWSLCGHTSVEMVLSKYENRDPSSNNTLTYNQMIRQHRNQSPLSSCSGSGTPNPNDLIWLVNQFGYQAKWYGSSASSYSNNQGELSLTGLANILNQGMPIIVQVHTSMNTSNGTHWMVLREIGTDYVKLNDPGTSYSSIGTNRSFTRQQFLDSWTSGACDKIALVISSKNTPNQSLPIYAGSTSDPKDFEVYFLKSQIDNKTPDGFVYNLKVGGKDINQTTAISTNSSWSSQIYRFEANPSNSNFSNLSNNNSYDVSFEVKTTDGSTYKFSGSQQVQLKEGSSLNVSLGSGADWLEEYVEKGIRYGLFSGVGGISSTSFGSANYLTREQAAKVIVAAAIQAHSPNRIINSMNPSNYFTDDVAPGDWSYSYIHTLRNWGVISGTSKFYKTDPITTRDFCRWLDLAMQFSSTDEAPLNSTSRVVVSIPGSVGNAANLQASMQRMNKILVNSGTSIINPNDKIEPIFASTDYSNVPSTYYFNGNIVTDGATYLTRAKMAKIITNAYIFAYKKYNNTYPNLRLNSSSQSNRELDITDVVVIGDKFENADITVGNAPVSVQQTYSIASGASLRIFYPSDRDGNSNPLHFYWSMVKNGATLNSDTVTHRSVTFKAPTVSTPTQWKLYSYNANNKGKSTEIDITINVGGATPTNIPVPTGVFMSANSATSFVIEWDRVSTNITQYIAQYSNDPVFISNVVTQNFNTSNATIYWTVTGQPSGTYYTRVKCVQNGIEGAWSNVASLNFSADFLPAFNENAFTPINNASVSGNNVTLSFPAIGGNAPLKYTVYFADFNPLGKPPVATDITSNTFTVSSLQYNQYYYWKVKVVDADGDEAWSNFYTVKINPETTPPTGSIAIENGAATTNSTSVNININVTDAQGSITAMRFSNDGISWPEYWDAYNTTRPAWNLVGYGGTSIPGIKTVYGQFRDNSGNVATFTDNITLATGVKGIFIVRNKKFETLRAANDYAVIGDTIFATAGYYDLTSEINANPYLTYTNAVGGGLKNGVSLIGEGADKTTLFWDGMTPMFGGLGCAGNNIVQGITFIVSVNPSSARATIMLHGANNVTIKNCIIKNGYIAIEGFNYGGSGNPSNLRIENNLIISNQSRSLHIRNCNGLYIYNNTINDGGFATVFLLDNSNVSFKNNIVSNSKAEAVSVYPNTSIVFSNNNIYNNRFSASSPIENYTNSSGYLSDQTGINGNISVDPNYTNLASNIFTLNTGSPCINTGVNVGLPFNGNAPEMGAYEFGGTGTLNINSNISTSFIITKPDGTQQTVNNGQTLTNLQSGIYGIYPSQKQGYYAPNIKFVYVSVNTTTNYYGYYRLDMDGPIANIYVNGDAYTTQSPYVTINSEANDEINGIQNGQMKFSNDGINWSNAEPISNKKLLWDLSNGNTNLSAGTKVVYAKFSDNNGFWSNTISDTIEYTPNAKIKIIEPNNGVYNLDFRNAILNSNIGDILLLKNGTHGVFGGSIVFPTGITIQGLHKNNSIFMQTSAITLGNGNKIDNVTMKPQSLQNFYTNSSAIPLPTIISNAITDNQNLQFSNQNLRVSNVIFKNISSFNNGFLQFYSNSSNSKLKVLNNVFDATVNNPNLNAELGVNITGMCCNNKFEIANNIFTGFDVGSNTGVNMAGAVRYSNSSSISIGDLMIRNNNFYNCPYKINKYNGSDISKDEFSYSYNPNFNADYILPTNSPLLNSGSNEIYFNNHNNTTNDIGITGGVYYNTPPTIQLNLNQTGTLNQYKISINASDEQTPTDKLQYRWDFNSDGIFDTAFLTTSSIVKVFNTTDSITCWVFDEHFSMNYIKVANPSITNPYTNSLTISATPNIICSGGQVNITPLINGIFSSNNQFEIQLSDNNGSFANSYSLLSFVNQTNDNLIANLPLGLLSGNLYKVRLKSTNPEIISNPTNAFTINASPNVAVALNRNPIGSVCAGNTIAFIANPTNGGSTPIYQWKVNGLNVGSNSNLYSSTQLKDGDIVWVEMKSNATCASQTPVVSTPITVNVTSVDTPFIQAIDNTLAASTDVGVQWYINGNPINGATSQFYEATQSGNYQVRVTQNGCTASSAIYNHSLVITGIKDNFISDNMLSIFPNPSSGTFSVKMDKAIAKNAQLAIYDVEGKVVHRQQLTNQQTDITTQNLASGVYVINIQLSENEIVKHKLVIMK